MILDWPFKAIRLLPDGLKLAAARLLVSASATISFSSLPCLRDCRYTKNLCARQPDYPLLKMSGKTPVLTEKGMYAP